VRRLARALLYGGTAVIVFGYGKYHAKYIGHYVLHGSSRFGWSFAFIGLLLIAAYSLGLPDLHRSSKAAAGSAIAAVAAASACISVADLALGSPGLLPRFVIFSSALTLVPFYALCAAIAADGRERAGDRDRVVAVLAADDATELSSELQGTAERPASLVEVMPHARARAGSPGEQPLFDTVLESRATVLVLDRAAQADQSIVDQAATLHETGVVRVRTLTLFYEEWLGKLPLGELERMSLMFDIGELHRARYGRLKRVADVAVALLGCIPLAVVTPLVVVGNLIANRGPLFYRQTRVGRYGSPFRIWKFRTMRSSDVSTWTAEDDPRITGFGRFLRKTHVDELPQVINILAGDLSLVGPRPEQPQYVEELTEKIPFYALRHLVRPGLTGWAQVKYDYGASEADALEKLQYEFFYLRHQGLALDARIVGRTLRSVFLRRGR
jgi:lipopolysaccharide/colanic/teichoic acid biosynthesis glycosyltransferase